MLPGLRMLSPLLGPSELKLRKNTKPQSGNDLFQLLGIYK